MRRGHIDGQAAAVATQMFLGLDLHPLYYKAPLKIFCLIVTAGYCPSAHFHSILYESQKNPGKLKSNFLCISYLSLLRPFRLNEHDVREKPK